MISNKKSSSKKNVLGITIKTKDMASIAGVQQLTTEFKCTVLQIKLISYNVANT